MTNIELYNTRSRSKELFNPIKPGKVDMYHCGPTVYDQAHLGNLCPYIYFDVLRRLFEFLDYEVIQVMNFTDIGHLVSDADSGNDKMVQALRDANKELTIENLHEHGKEIARKYLSDLADLNILIPHHLPYASKHIAEDIYLIKKLIEKDLAYITSDSILYNTAGRSDYDTFGVHGSTDDKGVRIQTDVNKRNPRDFSLWKFSDNDIGWDSPWGRGFPGWHIECSAMSWRYLGETFDIHTGGIEHIPIHHTNEIAQSEGVFDKPMANYWLHNNHLLLNGVKISKSIGNIIYLDELAGYDLHPSDFRYLILTSHYRSQQDVSIDSLRAAREGRKSLYKALVNVEIDDSDNESDDEVVDILSNDLDTPASLAKVREKLASANNEQKKALYNFVTRILGINFNDFAAKRPINPTPELNSLLDARVKAKLDKDYKLADNIRSQISDLGFELRDEGDKQVLYRSIN